ncbi:MAG TPA: PEPxxWA-CTERM sorting domain-containing protein [Caulobacteraceae bacterium]|nr:PEPxxWA-CTERM sorting domain-containing protein [Caulobacteraceae bacterium]
MAFGLCVLFTQSASAAAYVFTSAPSSAQGQQTLGFTFTANQDFTITSVGYYDLGGDGFQTDHEIGIYAGDGMVAPGALLVSTDLAAGESGVLGADSFRYQDITPLDVTAGSTYTIAGVSPNYSTLNDAFDYIGPDDMNGFAVSSLITIGPDAARYYYYTPTLVDPSLHYGNYQIYAVNFQGPGLDAVFTRPGSVPEPGAWALMLIGLGLAGGALRARRAVVLASSRR